MKIQQPDANKIKIDRAVGALENASTGVEKMSHSSTKTPWFLRFAPRAIRQWLNQWNWRQKTALVTALAITAGGVFYQNRAHAAALLGPILAAKPADFLVKFFIAYALGKSLNSAFAAKLQKTAAATPDGDPLYSNREYYKRVYSYDESGAGTELFRIDADANALFHKAYDASGTDTKLSPPPSIPTTSSTTA